MISPLDDPSPPPPIAEVPAPPARTPPLHLLAAARQGRLGSLEFTGGSMRPLLWPGDRVAVHFGTVACPTVGDLALLRIRSALVLHRIVDVDREGRRARTRGDASAREDAPVPFDDLLGTFAGIVDPATGMVRPWSCGRRSWDRALRLLIACRRGWFDPALLVGSGLYLVGLAAGRLGVSRPRRPLPAVPRTPIPPNPRKPGRSHPW